MQNDKEQMIWLGIHNRTRPIRYIKKIESIQESVDDIQKLAHYAIVGNNASEDAERLKKIVPETEIEKQTDSYLHDHVKQSLKKNNNSLSVGSTKHVLDIVSHPELPTDSLKKKWQHFVYVHTPKSVQKHKDLDSIFMKPEELDLAKSHGLVPYSDRVFKHIGAGHYFELHPDGNISYKGDSKALDRGQIADEYEERKNIDGKNWEHLSHQLDLESKSQRFDTTDHFTTYTGDQLHVNSALHKKAKGVVISKDDDTYEHEMHESGLDLADKISKQISKFLPLASREEFHVYTGVHSSIDPEVNESKVFHVPSFTSTSLKLQTANGFAQGKIDSKNRKVYDVFKVKIPRNFKNGVYIKPFSDHPIEEEYLIDKDQKYKVQPEPKHFVSNGSIYRLWDADLLPK